MRLDWILREAARAHTLGVMSAGFRRRSDPDPEPFRPAGSSPLRAVDAPQAAPSAPALERDSRTGLLERVAAAGIPWERILVEELSAEETLRRYLADIDGEWPLGAAVEILPLTFLRSWRIRERIQGLAARVRATHARDAQRELRRALASLSTRDEHDRATFTEHLWFAYQRVLLLQRVSRAAAASRGSVAERLAFICSRARCSYDDAVWAAGREDRPRPGHRLDAAVRKVRDEGFQIPSAATEARAFGELRRMVRASPEFARRRRKPRRLPGSDALPRRIPLPVDSV